MREVTILAMVLAGMFSSNVTHASGLMSIVTGAGAEASQILGILMTIFAIGLIGFGGSAILSMIGKGKFAGLFEKGCYLMAFSLFFGEAIKVFNKFIGLIGG